MATKPQTSTKPMMENRNVVGGRLAMFSKDPPTGYFRDGFCRTTPEDKGNHSIAATMTSEFLAFTASHGNNLQSAGVRPGQKWCLCASRWQEAMKAAQSGTLSEEAVPKVNLAATHESALETVTYKELKAFSAEGELRKSNRQEEHSTPESRGDSLSGQSQEIGGQDASVAPRAGERGQSKWTDLDTKAGGGTGVAHGR